MKAGINKTHSVIGRILRNKVYIGTEYYPQIIDEDTFATLSLMRKKPRPSVGFTESTWKVQASETLRMDWNGTKSRPEANDINGI